MSKYQNSLEDIEEGIRNEAINYLRLYLEHNKVTNKSGETIGDLRACLQHIIATNKEGEEISQAEVLREMIADDPETWWRGHHFFWGMQIRNKLRSQGFGEEELKVENLDDYYISLVEAAVIERK